MVRIEEIAQAALDGDGLRVRSLTQDFLREHPRLVEIPQPDTDNATVLAVSASLLELFASRTDEEAPPWTDHIGPVSEPIYLLKSAHTMPRLRALCEAQSPTPLRKRRFFAPPNYLEFA